MSNTQPTFIDLFAGIGGFRLGFEQAGYQCVYACEIDPACQEVYTQNFGESPDSDITQIQPYSLPDFDVLTAGFPCQPFSICGKRQGFEDTRGTLFFHLCEIIAAKQPRIIVLENVKYLLHHDQGKTFEIILFALDQLAYQVSYKLLNAKNFGVPQNRERIIIVASQKQNFDFTQLRMILPPPKLETILCSSGDFEYLDSSEYVLIEKPKQQRSGLIFVGYRCNKSIWKTGIRPGSQHLSRVHRQPNRIYSSKGTHPTLPSQETAGRFFIYIPEQGRVRKLTLTECYRLMGFPDSFKRYKTPGECYKQIGNSICVPMAYEIAVQVIKQFF